MKNKYKTAGIWNILCGVLFTIAYIFPNVLICIRGVTLGSDHKYETFVSLFISLIFSGYGWRFFIYIPFFMILTGTEMLSKRKKGAGVKALIVFTIIVKILAAVFEVAMGCMLLTGPTSLLVAWGTCLIVLALVMLVSIVIDCKALLAKAPKKLNRKNA